MSSATDHRAVSISTIINASKDSLQVYIYPIGYTDWKIERVNVDVSRGYTGQFYVAGSIELSNLESNANMVFTQTSVYAVFNFKTDSIYGVEYVEYPICRKHRFKNN